MPNLLVVGASSDIGVAAIQKIIDNYEHVFAHYRTNNEQFDTLCKKYSNKIIPIQADLLDDELVDSMIKLILSYNIIPNHIIYLPSLKCDNNHFYKMNLEEIKNFLEVGIYSLCKITKPFIKEMSSIDGSRIIVMLSDVLKTNPAYCSQYVISKYAMLGYVKAISSEFVNTKLKVFGISPGWVNTKFISNQPNYIIQNNINKSKLKRLYEPKEVVKVIEKALFDNDICTGTNIYLDEYFDIKS